MLKRESSMPSGCAIVPVSDNCEAYLMLKGALDVEKEIQRLEVKKEKAQGALKKLSLTMEAADYKKKVPVDIQVGDKEKLDKLNGELEKVIEAIRAISLISK